MKVIPDSIDELLAPERHFVKGRVPEIRHVIIRLPGMQDKIFLVAGGLLKHFVPVLHDRFKVIANSADYCRSLVDELHEILNAKM